MREKKLEIDAVFIGVRDVEAAMCLPLGDCWVAPAEDARLMPRGRTSSAMISSSALSWRRGSPSGVGILPLLEPLPG